MIGVAQDWARSPQGRKWVKYGVVSAVGVVVTQVLLLSLHGLAGWSAWLANLTAVSVATVPTYLLNRYWVWRKTDRNRLMGEVIPFWAMGLAGLVLSTVAVSVVDRWTDSSIVLGLTNLASFGALWVVKFMLLDRVLFHHRAPVPEP